MNAVDFAKNPPKDVKPPLEVRAKVAFFRKLGKRERTTVYASAVVLINGNTQTGLNGDEALDFGPFRVGGVDDVSPEIVIHGVFIARKNQLAGSVGPIPAGILFPVRGIGTTPNMGTCLRVGDLAIEVENASDHKAEFRLTLTGRAHDTKGISIPRKATPQTAAAGGVA